MDNYHITRKNNSIGSTFLRVKLNPAGIPTVMLKSLAAKISLLCTRTKLCPFCEETIRKEACVCSFCNRTLMKKMNFRTQK